MQDQAGQNQQSTAPRARRCFKANVMHACRLCTHARTYPNCSMGGDSPHKRIVLNNNYSVAEKQAAERQAADRQRMRLTWWCDKALRKPHKQHLGCENKIPSFSPHSLIFFLLGSHSFQAGLELPM